MINVVPAFPPTQRHSGLGIASLVIAVVSFVSSLMLFVVAYAVGSSSDISNPNEGSPINYVLGGWIFGTGVLSLIGIVFGIGGLLQKERRKKLAAVGLVSNVVLPIGLMFILVMAMTLNPPSSPAARDVGVRYAARDTRGSTALADNHEPPAWKSPAARVFQLATAAMASAVVFFLQRKRSTSANPSANPSATSGAAEPCPRCGKPLPGPAGFCRRCGLRRAS